MILWTLLVHGLNLSPLFPALPAMDEWAVEASNKNIKIIFKR